MHPAVLDSVSQYCYIACMRYDQLLSELSDALERGDVSPRAVERLMRRSRPATRPDLPGLLRALGALTMFAGAAMLYAIQYHSLGTTTQRVSPLIFPVVALAAAVALRRAGRPSWEVELAGVVGFVAYGMAVATIGVSADAGVRFGVLAGLVAAAVVILMHRLLGITRLTVWGSRPRWWQSPDLGQPKQGSCGTTSAGSCSRRRWPPRWSVRLCWDAFGKSPRPHGGRLHCWPTPPALMA